MSRLGSLLLCSVIAIVLMACSLGGNTTTTLPASTFTPHPALATMEVAHTATATATAKPTQAPMFVTPTPIPTMNVALEIAAAQAKWKAQNVFSYRIHLSYYEGFAVGLRTQRTVTVKNGQVISSSCSREDCTPQPNCAPNGCPGFSLRDVFTVEDLFDTALHPRYMKWSDDDLNKCTNLQLDPTYGFPRLIALRCRQLPADGESSVSVKSFEVLQFNTQQ
jgi:hypothetical protein